MEGLFNKISTFKDSLEDLRLEYVQFSLVWISSWEGLWLLSWKNNLGPNKKMKIIPILTGYGLTAVLKMLGMYYKTSRAKRISIKTHQRVTHLGACLIDDHFSDLILDPLHPLCHKNLTFGNVGWPALVIFLLFSLLEDEKEM